MKTQRRIQNEVGGSDHQRYTTEDELADYLGSLDASSISKPEIERLYLTRRRLSIELKHEKVPAACHAMQHLLDSNNCANEYPYKVVILGDDIIKRNPNTLDLSHMPPCDIQTQILQVRDPDTSMSRSYGLELFVPICEREYNELRPQFFQAADVFVVIFSIKSHSSLDEARNIFLPEIRRFIDNNSKLGDIPIVLVGNHTEVREESSGHDIVDSDDAVQVAHQFQVSKYIEVFSENLFHVQEIFQQSIHAINSFHSISSIPVSSRKKLNAEEDSFLRSLLTVPTPEGEFDQFEKIFEINTLEGVDYYYTLDDSDPNKLSQHYNLPFKIKTPYPKIIRVSALGRCKYTSDVASFVVPDESDEPFGYFDPISKGFHIATKPNTIYFVTTDGSKPDKNSTLYSESGLLFDDNPNSCFLDPPQLPQLIRVLAVEHNKFKSKTRSFRPYEVLSQPTVHLTDGMLRIDTIPGIVYKYTLDGSVPNYNSPTYSRPVMLALTSQMKSIRVAAFPKLYFPSKMVELPLTLPKSPTKKEGSQQNIKMTRSAIQRLQHSSTLNEKANSNSNNLAHHRSSQTMLNKGRSVSPFTEASSTGLRTRSNNSPPRSKSTGRVITTSIAKQKDPTSISSSTRNKDQALKGTVSKVETPRQLQQQSSKGCAVTCRAEGTNVEFSFEKYVLVSRIIIKTPGKGNGPEGYEIYMIEEHSGKRTRIGDGILADIEGEQIMSLNDEFQRKIKEERLNKLLCTFRTARGQKTFKILDMKVDFRAAD